jgi:hypothetical protein
MLKRIRNHILIALTSISLAVPLLVPAMPVYAANAACNPIALAVNSGVNATTQNNPQSCGTGGSISSGIQSLASKIVNIFSIIVGIASVLMIIYSGFRYVTSGGESNSVSSAKNTLIYAIVGLIIVIISQLIVRYVLGTAANISTS